MMGESVFGRSGFRYFGKPSREDDAYPMYSLFVPQQARRLLQELRLVEPHFASLPEGQGSQREQFFEGLLAPVTQAAEGARALWVQTD